MKPKKRGRKPGPDVEMKRDLVRLQRENQRLQKELSQAACEAFDVPRATFYRCRVSDTGARQTAREARPRRRSHRRLGDEERREVREVLHSDRFVDKAPAEIVATLLDEQRYLCSERTMYRLLAESGEGGERRNKATSDGVNTQ